MKKENPLRKRRLWIITIVVFVLFVAFFDRNSFMDRRELKRDIRELERQRDYYREHIRQDSTLLRMLEDDDYLEQYARENYLMLRDGDSVYVIRR